MHLMSTRPQSAGANRSRGSKFGSPGFDRPYETLEHQRERDHVYSSRDRHRKQEVLWKGHTPNKPKMVEVMTMNKMGTTEKLHNSHFYNMSVAAGAVKHQKLILNAKTQVDSKLHPFVQSERERLKARKHLEAVDELTKDVDIPDTLKHHSAFNAVYGWILTHNQHHERISKLTASISNTLPAHCKHFRDLRDSNRIKAMSEQQRKNYVQRLEREKLEASARRRRLRDNQEGMIDYAGADTLRTEYFKDDGEAEREQFMDFLCPETPYSNTGLRRANTHSIGHVEQPSSAGTKAREQDAMEFEKSASYLERNNSSRERAGAKLRGTGENMSYQKKPRPTSAPSGRKVLPKKTYVYSNFKTQPAARKGLLDDVDAILKGSRPVQHRQSQQKKNRDRAQYREEAVDRPPPVWRDDLRQRVQQKMSSSGNMILMF